jgi:hypothetical protein
MDAFQFSMRDAVFTKSDFAVSYQYRRRRGAVNGIKGKRLIAVLSARTAAGHRIDFMGFVRKVTLPAGSYR